MDFLESKKPSPDEVMQFIKPSAIASLPAAANGETESVRSVLNRVLARV
jgi:hypothetical protein